MTRGQKRSLMRRGHRWLGLVVALLVLVVAGSGIVLQHPQWLGAVQNEPLCLAVDPADPDRMLRGTHWGVEVSTDGGRQWREVAMLAAPTDVGRILFVSQGTDTVVYALGTASLVASSDGGRIWREVPGPAGELLFGAEFLDLTVSRDGALSLLTTVGQYHRSVGEDWSPVGVPPEPARDWQRFVHDLHTGHVFGQLGRRTAEGGAWGLILLTVSGLVLHRRVGSRRQK